MTRTDTAGSQQWTAVSLFFLNNEHARHTCKWNYFADQDAEALPPAQIVQLSSTKRPQGKVKRGRADPLSTVRVSL